MRRKDKKDKKEDVLVVVILDALCVLIWGTKTICDFVITSLDYSPLLGILDAVVTVIWLLNFIKWFGRYKELKAEEGQN